MYSQFHCDGFFLPILPKSIKSVTFAAGIRKEDRYFEMDDKSGLGRLVALLFLTMLFCAGMYFLPASILGYKIKRVDLLSDFKVEEKALSLDSLRLMLEEPDTIQVDSALIRDSLQRVAGIDSAMLALRDSLYQTLYAAREADSLGKRVEDYSLGHIGLRHFFAALKQGETLGRPVRVAFLGDSFIEGDILVADLRAALQQVFGGEGVGFVPVNSVAAKFRPTVKQEGEGWQTISMLDSAQNIFTPSGMLFLPDGERPEIRIDAQDTYTKQPLPDALKLLYARNGHARICRVMDTQADTSFFELPPSDRITEYRLNGSFQKMTLGFSEVEGLEMLGTVMESESGIIVDNYSLRGNSGMVLDRLDSVRCRQLNEVRPYDLVIMQYGLNVVNDTIMNYGWYGSRMRKVVHHVKACFPEADLLMVGVSDRSRMVNGQFETIPAVLSLLYTQRQVARQTGIVFWNLFGAMGGVNSMTRYVEKNWAGKDYTHLGFRGGKEIAKALFDALLLEKEFYDEVDKQLE